MSGDTLRREVLIDLGDMQASPLEESMARFKLQLVHPQDAIQWVATGAFHSSPVPAVREWWRFGDGFDVDAFAREEGRIDLAVEVVLHAIEQGRLRCAFVERSEKQPRGGMDAQRLVVIPPEDLAPYAIGFSDDESGTLDLSLRLEDGEVDYDNWFSLHGVCFLWNEITELRPRRAATESGAFEMAPAPTPAPPPPVRPAPQLQQSRGKRPRHYGAPISQFLARMIREGIEAAANEKNETLGRWLIEEFEACGETNLPDLRNASADARGAINAWISAVANNNGPGGE